MAVGEGGLIDLSYSISIASRKSESEPLESGMGCRLSFWCVFSFGPRAGAAASLGASPVGLLESGSFQLRGLSDEPDGDAFACSVRFLFGG